MWKAQAQLGIDGAGSHEVGCDLVSADEAFPAAVADKKVSGGRVTFETDLSFCPLYGCFIEFSS